MPDIGTIQNIGAIGLLEGDRYISYRKIQTLGTNASEDVLFRNPVDSGLIAAVDAPVFDASGRVETELYSNVDVTDAGTAITPRNARIGYSDNATMLVSQDATVTGGTLVNDSFAGSGGGGSTALAGEQSGISLLVEPGNNIHLIARNETNSSIDRVHIEVDFTEFKEDLIAPSQ